MFLDQETWPGWDVPRGAPPLRKCEGDDPHLLVEGVMEGGAQRRLAERRLLGIMHDLALERGTGTFFFFFFFSDIQMKKAEVRPVQLGWLKSSLGALPCGLGEKGLLRASRHRPGRGGVGIWGGGVPSFLSRPNSASTARPSGFSPLSSLPAPRCTEVPVPRPSWYSRTGTVNNKHTPRQASRVQ